MSALADAAAEFVRRGGYDRAMALRDALDADAGLNLSATQQKQMWNMLGAAYRAGCEDGRARENHERGESAAKPDPITVGCEVLRVRRFPGGKPKLLARTTVKRPTSTQWVTSDGYRFGNDSRRACLGYKNEFLMTESEFVAAGGVL